MKKFRASVWVELTMVVEVDADVVIEAKNEKEARKILAGMAEGGKANMKAITEVPFNSFQVKEEKIYQDFMEAIEGRRKGGVGGKVHNIDCNEIEEIEEAESSED